MVATKWQTKTPVDGCCKCPQACKCLARPLITAGGRDHPRLFTGSFPKGGLRPLRQRCSLQRQRYRYKLEPGGHARPGAAPPNHRPLPGPFGLSDEGVPAARRVQWGIVIPHARYIVHSRLERRSRMSMAPSPSKEAGMRKLVASSLPFPLVSLTFLCSRSPRAQADGSCHRHCHPVTAPCLPRPTWRPTRFPRLSV